MQANSVCAPTGGEGGGLKLQNLSVRVLWMTPYVLTDLHSCINEKLEIFSSETTFILLQNLTIELP